VRNVENIITIICYTTCISILTKRKRFNNNQTIRAMAATKIFESYEAFEQRADRTQNGASAEFAEAYWDDALAMTNDNAGNEGC